PRAAVASEADLWLAAARGFTARSSEFSVYLATAFDQPVNTIADRKQRKTCTSEGPGRATYVPMLAIAMVAISSIKEFRRAECHATHQPKKESQNSENFSDSHFSVLLTPHKNVITEPP